MEHWIWSIIDENLKKEKQMETYDHCYEMECNQAADYAQYLEDMEQPTKKLHLYIITLNGKRWETTNLKEADRFTRFLHNEATKMISKPYDHSPIDNIMAAW